LAKRKQRRREPWYSSGLDGHGTEITRKGFNAHLADALDAVFDSAIPRDLSEALWNAVVFARSPESSAHSMKFAADLIALHERAQVQATTAAAIGTQARRLLSLLERSTRNGVEELAARELVSLPSAWEVSLADLQTMGGWAAARKARGALSVLAREAEMLATIARARGRKPRGRRHDHLRRRLGQWVAIVLGKAAVPLTRSGRGVFARVLALTFLAAGFPPERNFERDVRRALDDPSVQEYLADLQRGATT